MKIEDLKDDQIVYVLLTSGEFYLGRMAYLKEEHANKIKEKVLDLCPGTVIAICETVASDLPRDFDIYEMMVKNEIRT